MGNQQTAEQNVEQRLEMALFYRTVLQSLTPDEGISPVQKQVVEEIQDFVRTRMKVLMGLEAEKKTIEQLSSDDVSILKQVADKLRNPEQDEEEKERPVAKPRPPSPQQQQKKPQKPAPKTPTDPNALPMGLTATGKIMEMPFQVRGPGGLPVDKIKIFKEVIAPDGSNGWYGQDGQLYVIKEDPASGATFMQNVTKQAQSATHRRVPRTHGMESVMLAAEQADRLTRGKSQSRLILEAADRLSDAESMGITLAP